MTAAPLPLQPAELADVWRNPEDPRWREAFLEIRRLLLGAAKKHSILHGLPKSELPERKTELTHEFWVYLTENPAALEARRVRGSGALVVAAARFLDQLHSDGAQDFRRRWRFHLKEKVRTALRSDGRFEKVRQWWQLRKTPEPTATDATPTSPGSAKNLGLAELLRRLPRLPARMKAQRAGQLPPLVDAKLLPDFLERCLALWGRPRTVWQLQDLAWSKIHPPLDGVLPFRPSPWSGEPERMSELPARALSPEELAIRSEWAARIDVVASAFVDSLPARAARVMRLVASGQTVRAVAAQLGVSVGTVTNDHRQFKERFDELSARERLDDAQKRQLENVVLNILRVEPFLSEGENGE